MDRLRLHRRCAKLLTKEEKFTLETSYRMTYNACRSLMDLCETLIGQCNDHRKKETLYGVFSKMVNDCADMRVKLAKVFPEEDML